MFDFLKKKIGGFIDGLTKKEESKETEGKIAEGSGIGKEEPVLENEPEKVREEKTKPAKAEIAPKKKTEEKKPEEKKPEKKIPQKQDERKAEAAKPVPEKKEPARITAPVEKKTEPRPAILPAEPKTEEKRPAIAEKQALKTPTQPPSGKKPIVEKKQEEPDLQPCAIILIPKAEDRKPAEKAKEPEIKPPEPVRYELEIEEEPAQKRQDIRLPIEKPEPPKALEKKQEPARAEPKEEIKPRIKLNPFSAIKSIITQEVEIGEGEVRELLENLELELLESDVEMGVAQSIKDELSEKLIGAKVKKSELHPFISSSIKQTLTDVLRNENAFGLVEKVQAGEKPLKIMFIGINGAGKTTTIAKVAKLLMDNDLKVVFAAADTFRAAAIEQMEVHAGRLGVKTIKRDYGSDPTSVAYDAVGYAKAHGIDAVLIDTAGRQDTNISLLNEIKKMSRVIGPDLKIYIGESISGNAILEQISAFNREVGIDAVILTKMDCDPKGGTMLSISKVTGIPIIYVGTGQAYTDLERFVPERIASRIVGEN